MMDARRLADYEHMAQAIGRFIGDRLPKDTGFCLMIFSTGDREEATYISNCARDDMVKAVREMADKVEARIDRPPMMQRPGGTA